MKKEAEMERDTQKKESAHRTSHEDQRDKEENSDVEKLVPNHPVLKFASLREAIRAAVGIVAMEMQYEPPDRVGIRLGGGSGEWQGGRVLEFLDRKRAHSRLTARGALRRIKDFALRLVTKNRGNRLPSVECWASPDIGGKAGGMPLFRAGQLVADHLLLAGGDQQQYDYRPEYDDICLDCLNDVAENVVERIDVVLDIARALFVKGELRRDEIKAILRPRTEGSSEVA
jgi:hypothetical protein